MANSASAAVTAFIGTGFAQKAQAGVNQKVICADEAVSLALNEEHGLAILPASAIVTGLYLTASNTLNITADVGLYRGDRTVATTTPTLIDIDCFADNVAINGATVDATYSGAGAINFVGQKLYEIDGLTEPNVNRPQYEIALSAVAVTDGVGDLGWIITYVEP